MENKPDSERMKFIVYLLPELSKLKSKDECEKFLLKVKEKKIKERDLKLLKISTDLNNLTKQFNNPQSISNYLNQLSYYELTPLTYILSKLWRKNLVYDKIINNKIWEEKLIDIEDVYISKAESSIHSIFKKHNYKLTSISNDKSLWTHKPYNEYSFERKIEYPVCMAEEIENRYIIFDGIHRAIQMAYNNYGHIRLYVYQEI